MANFPKVNPCSEVIKYVRRHHHSGPIGTALLLIATTHFVTSLTERVKLLYKISMHVQSLRTVLSPLSTTTLHHNRDRLLHFAALLQTHSPN